MCVTVCILCLWELMPGRTMWVWKIRLKLAGLHSKHLYLLSHLACPKENS